MDKVILQKGRGRVGGAVVLGALVTLLLIAISVARHPASIQGDGEMALIQDVALLLACAGAGTWVWRERRSAFEIAVGVGAQFGVVLGLVFMVRHAIESFAPMRDEAFRFLVGAGPVLLMLGLFGVAGSKSWERTRSILLTMIAGIWCAVVAVPMLLGFAFLCNLLFDTSLELRLHEAFVASGMIDPGAFLVRNSLQAASEFLVRMPLFALFVSLIGGLAHAWIAGRSRTAKFVAAWLTPLMLVTGAAALWYANSLERSARPPFIMAGVLLAGVALSGAHPIWSCLRHTGQSASVNLTD